MELPRYLANNPHIRPATIKDALQVAANLRPEDRREVECLGQSVLSLPILTEMSDFAVTLVSPKSGKLAGVAGILPDQSKPTDRVGIVWMLCTPVIKEQVTMFVRGAKLWLEDVGPNYDYLWNLADSRNHLHRKLLKHLGFRAIREVYPAPYYIPYLEIIKLCASPSSD